MEKNTAMSCSIFLMVSASSRPMKDSTGMLELGEVDRDGKPAGR